MMMGIRIVRKLGPRGTLTIPREAIEVLGLDKHDIVEFDLLRIVKRANDLPSIDANEAVVGPASAVPGRTKNS